MIENCLISGRNAHRNPDTNNHGGVIQLYADVKYFILACKNRKNHKYPDTRNDLSLIKFDILLNNFCDPV
jgi:hypothetical protein